MKRYLGWFAAGLGVAFLASVAVAVLRARCTRQQPMEEMESEEMESVTERITDARQPVA